MSVPTIKKVSDKSEVEDLDKYQEISINNVRQRFIICNECRSILTWAPSDGTNVMKKHSAGCTKAKEPPPETQPRITSIFKESSQVTTKQLRGFKSKILRGVAEMCVLDSRPFNITHGQGFEQFSKQIYDAGKYFGNMVDVKQLLPHRTTISRDVDRLYSSYHEKLRDLCKTITSFGITVDFWTEEFSGISFAGVVLHFFKENKGLVSLLLCCRAYDLTDSTAPNVRLFVDQILNEFNLKLTVKQFVVTDNEPKMKCSFKENTIRIGCSCHYLNKILEKSFTHKDSNCEEVRQLFDTTRPIVTHLIRSHKQALLNRRLQLYCKTRWNSVYSMFFTFNENFYDLRTLLDKNHQQSFDTIDQDLLCQLISFLKLFVDITERLSNEKQATLHLVLPCRQKLIQVSGTSSSDEHPGLVEFKKYFLQHIESDWPVQDEHYIATVLHPQFKQLDIFSKNIRRHAHELVRNKIQNDLMPSSSSTTAISTPSSSSTITITTTTTSPSSSISCSDKVDLFSSLYDKPPDTNKSKCEFEMYLDSDLRLQEGEDLLHFWMQQRGNYPQLYELAKRILIIPASNTAVERLFSVPGATITEKRTRLALEKIDKMMFLNKNLAFLKSLYESNLNRPTEEAADPLFIPSKRILSTDLSKSPSQTKRRRLSGDEEPMSSEQYEHMQSDDDEDTF